MNETAKRLSIFCMAFCALASSVSAQITSTIEGIVKDAQGSPIPGVVIGISSPALATERNVTTNSEGFYRVTILPAGIYQITARAASFSSRQFQHLEVTLNRSLSFDITLDIGTIKDEIAVSSEAPLLEQSSSNTGSTITSRKIVELPVNGRDYLDLLQLVPGVAINRRVNPGNDNATPALGERSGNNNFLIDGQPNKDTFGGGASAQFNQDTIAEFQVITAGYKAEFGQASGAIVNVISKSGTNALHGIGSLYHRNNAFDASNSLDANKTDAPFLHRWDYTLALGGPIIKDKVFFFGSSERITETRRFDFFFPPATPQVVRDIEINFDHPLRYYETRNFIKFDQHLGRHHLTQQMNYTNWHVTDYLPLAAANNLPSTRNNFFARNLLLGFGDTFLAGDQNQPWVITLRGGYRDEPSGASPSHPEAGPATRFNLFNSLTTGRIFGNLGQIQFGNGSTPSQLTQQYTSLSASAARFIGRHHLKFGWNFLRTKVDGIESQSVFNQLFATLDDFAKFGPINSGFFTLSTAGGVTPKDNEIHLRNNYHGLYAQDDWKLHRNLTVNFGLRWDHDSQFPNKRNFSPRLGAAWAITPRTIVRGSFGVFYDQFRLTVVRSIPEFGGADIRAIQPLSYPRGFYGVPTIIPFFERLCLSPTLTDAQIAASGARCTLGPQPLIGVDRLNRVVAPGHALIPANAVINLSNIQSLSGLSPAEYARQASLAVGQPENYFFWGAFGALSNSRTDAQQVPWTVDPGFRTPHTQSFNIGVQRELSNTLVIEADYHHRKIQNILGLRHTNLAFVARIPGRERTFLPPNTARPVIGFGPWYEGTYNGLVLSFDKRLSRRFIMGGNYGYARATDNQLGFGTLPSDSFVGEVPVVTDPATGQSNQNGSFTASNGNFVPQAGTFFNGPDFDKGPSDLALNHTFQLHGLLELPWQVQLSGIFRAQSGYHFSRLASVPIDKDGNSNFNGIDNAAGRNAFIAPRYVNLDMRFAKRFKFSERVRAQFLFEFFNLLNNANPAAVEVGEGRPIPFGTASQVLPGREGQIGIRIEF